MLVVFTAFLGMERKSAVGTSTLIMTFTALIAFVSHSLVDPTIVLERWDILILCIVVESAASIISARFANRVNNRIVGLVTGAVLTILGVIMLGIHYRELIMKWVWLKKVLICFQWCLVYLGGWLIILFLLKHFLPISKELWRKMLHLVAYTSSLFMMFEFHDWTTAAICCLLFAAVVYPILHFCERIEGYADLFNERHSGEVKKSLLLLFCTHAVLIAVCWGILDKPYIAVTAILTWGVGDTAAALIGKRYGRHHVHLPLADQKKTWEGSTAMAVTAFITGFLSMWAVAPLSWNVCLGYAVIFAPLAAYVELISHKGNDTVTVPAAVAVCIGLLSYLI